MNNFKYAVENKFRFPYKGQISVEDLFDLGVDALNTIYQNLNKQLRDMCADSLLSDPTSESTHTAIKIEIVKEIFEDKKKAIEDNKNAVIKNIRKQNILKIIEDKENDDLKNMSIEELKKIVSEL